MLVWRSAMQTALDYAGQGCIVELASGCCCLQRATVFRICAVSVSRTRLEGHPKEQAATPSSSPKWGGSRPQSKAAGCAGLQVWGLAQAAPYAKFKGPTSQLEILTPPLFGGHTLSTVGASITTNIRIAYSQCSYRMICLKHTSLATP